MKKFSVTLANELDKDDGSIILIPTISICWNWYSNVKQVAISVSFLIWDLTFKYKKIILI